MGPEAHSRAIFGGSDYYVVNAINLFLENLMSKCSEKWGRSGEGIAKSSGVWSWSASVGIQVMLSLCHVILGKLVPLKPQFLYP